MMLIYNIRQPDTEAQNLWFPLCGSVALSVNK